MIDIFTKYAWVKALKDKKAKVVLRGFVGIVNKSKRRPDKLLVDEGKELYNSFMQESLDNNDILLYSTHNEGNSVVVERFTRTLKVRSIQK